MVELLVHSDEGVGLVMVELLVHGEGEGVGLVMVELLEGSGCGCMQLPVRVGRWEGLDIVHRCWWGERRWG